MLYSQRGNLGTLKWLALQPLFSIGAYKFGYTSCFHYEPGPLITVGMVSLIAKQSALRSSLVIGKNMQKLSVGKPPDGALK